MHLKELEHFDFFKKKINKTKIAHPKIYKAVVLACQTCGVGLLALLFSSVMFLGDLNNTQIKQVREFYLVQNNYFLNNSNDKNIIDNYFMLINAQKLTYSILDLQHLFETTEVALKDPNISFKHKQFIKSVLYQHIMNFNLEEDINCNQYISCSLIQSDKDKLTLKEFKDNLIDKLKKIDIGDPEPTIQPPTIRSIR